MGMNPRLLRPTASGFRPSQISGLSAWYDASVASSVTLTGGFVSQWSDLSGGGLHLTQATEANRPGTATVNGRTAIDFDGSNDYLFTTAAPTASGTVFCAHLLDAASVAYSLYHLQSGTGGTSTRMHLLYSSVNEYRSQGVSGGGVNVGVSGGSRTANPRIVTNTFSGTAVTGRVDGSALGGTTTASGSDQQGFWVGIRNIGGTLSLPLDGKLCEVVTYNRVLSAAEITQVERYLAAKWGVTLYSPPTYADADVNAYITAVELADGGLMLEPGVRDAINDFITGCKADGIWTAIKASCILMGARTLAGALVPLKGTAPTNNGPFVSGDYNRETGLVGNGTTKFLNTNRASNADLQNNVHAAVWVSTAEPTANGGVYLGAGGFGINGSINIGSSVTSNLVFFRARTSTIDEISSTANATGLIGIARSSGTEYSHRINSTNATVVRASQTAISDNTLIFGRNVSGAVQLPTSGRLAFYSIGESLNLALLDTRVSALITAIGAAIP